MIPIGDDNPTRTMPLVTWSLIGVNIVAFLLCFSNGLRGFNDTVLALAFPSEKFGYLTIFTSMFLHGDPLHIIGNMLYLWIFGDNVEDAFGHLRFLAFYLAAGIAASLMHLGFDGGPAVGASGAIAGVLGAYILLFPGYRVRVLFWWYFYVRVFMIRAGWLIGIYFALQIVFVVLIPREFSSVAYWAHIGGFIAGLGATSVLLAAKFVTKPPAPPSPADSRLMRAAAEAGVLPYMKDNPDADVEVRTNPDGSSTVFTKRVVSRTELPTDPAERLRLITASLAAGDVDKAVEAARIELKIPTAHALPADSLVTLADSFYRGKVHVMAFHLYSAFLKRAAADDGRVPEVEFRAGMVASRQMRDFAVAHALLADVVKRHARDDRRLLAQRELDSIRSNLDRTSITDDPALLDGPCAVVRQTSDPVNIAAVGRVVSDATGKPLADLTRLLKGSVGFVAKGLEPLVAKSVAAALQEMDIPVLVIPEKKLVALPAARNVSWAAVTPEGISLALDPRDASPVVKVWEDIFYASAGLISFRRQKRIIDDDTGGLGHGIAPMGFGMGAMRVSSGSGFRYKEERYDNIVFDVFTLNPFECFRLVEGKVDFRGAPQALTQSANLNYRRLIRDFLAHGAGAPVNQGVELVATDAPLGRWKGITFNSMSDFERYNYWRLQLEQYG